MEVLPRMENKRECFGYQDETDAKNRLEFCTLKHTGGIGSDALLCELTCGLIAKLCF